MIPWLKQFCFLCLFVLLVVGCGNAEIEVTNVLPTLTMTPTLTIPSTMSPTAVPPSITPTVTQTSVPTATPTEQPTFTPTPTPTVSSWTVEGTAVFQTSDIISPANAVQLTQLARWGRGVIHDVAYSPNGRWLAAASATGIYLHNGADLNETSRWIQTNVPVDKVAFSPDGTLIAAILPRTGVHIWQVENGELVTDIPETAEGFSFSPDGQSLALIMPSYLQQVQIWSLIDNEVIAEFNGSTALAFSPDGTSYALATDSDRSTYIEIYQLPDHELMKRLEVDSDGYAEGVVSLEFADNNQLLILGIGFYGQKGDTGLIEVRESSDGKLLYTIESLPASPRTPYVCDSNFVDYDAPSPPSPVSIKVSPDGQHFAVKYKEGDTYGASVIVYRLLNGQLQHKFTEGTNSLSYSPDGNSIVTGSADGNIYTWQTDTFELNEITTVYNSAISEIGYSPGGIVLATESKYGVELRDATDGKLLRKFPAAQRISFSPDGKLLAMGFPDGRIEVLNLIEEVLAYQITDYTSPVQELTFTPDSQHLIVMTQNCTKSIYQASDGSFLHSLEDFIADVEPVGETRLPVGSIAVSDDGSKLVGSFTAGPQFGFWQIDTGKLISVLPEEEIAGIWNFISVPNKELFAGLGGTYSTTDFSFWDMTDASFMFEWSGPDRSNFYYVRLAATPDGRLLFAPTNQGTVDIWEFDSQGVLHTLLIDTFVYRVDFFYSPSIAGSPDGRYLAAGTSDGLIYLWGVP
jgi:WD40 repeat protein